MLNCTLTHKGGFFKISDLKKKYGSNSGEIIYNKITNALTKKIPTFGNNIKVSTLYKEMQLGPEYYCRIPRMTAFALQDLKIIDTIENKLPQIKKIDPQTQTLPKSLAQLKEHQKIVINHLVGANFTESNIRAGKGTALLEMEAGFGKTYIIIGLVDYFTNLYGHKLKTLVITPTEYVLFQNTECMQKNYPDLKVGVYSGKKKEDGDIVVAIINTLLSDKIDDNWFQQFNIVVYDEVHKYCSDEFSKIFYKAQSQITLGMSATVVRPTDQQEFYAIKNLGEIIYANKIDGFNKESDKITFSGTVNIIHYHGPEEFTKQEKNATTNTVLPYTMYEQFINDPYRNAVIFNETIKLYDMGKNIFIFSERRDHLDFLQIELTRFLRKRAETSSIENAANQTIPNIIIEPNKEQIAKLMGGTSAEQREIAKRTSSIILMTYGYGDVGVSIARMDALVLATPRRSMMRQKIGRIFRLDGDQTQHRIIIDIVDANVKLKSQLADRKKAYKTRKLTIKKTVIKYDEVKCVLGNLGTNNLKK